MDTATVLQCFISAAEAMPAHQQALCELDMRIGDGDHGVTMARGFRAFVEAAAGQKDTDAEAFFLAVSTAMMDSMGGAIGPIYGLFMEELAHAHAKGRAPDAASLADGFMGAVERIGSLCRVQEGEKTVYDAMAPAARALKEKRQDTLATALENAVLAAKAGRDATVGMVARKGRAKFLMDKSVGPVDAGASSFVLWLEALRDAVMEEIKR